MSKHDELITLLKDLNQLKDSANKIYDKKIKTLTTKRDGDTLIIHSGEENLPTLYDINKDPNMKYLNKKQKALSKAERKKLNDNILKSYNLYKPKQEIHNATVNYTYILFIDFKAKVCTFKVKALK